MAVETKYVSREVITGKLLAALKEGHKFAIVVTLVDLEVLIAACRYQRDELGFYRRKTANRLDNLLERLEDLWNAASGT